MNRPSARLVRIALLKFGPLMGCLYANGCYNNFGGVLERALAPTAFENALTIPSSFLSGLLTALAASQG